MAEVIGRSTGDGENRGRMNGGDHGSSPAHTKDRVTVGTLVISVDSGPSYRMMMKDDFRRSRQWEALCKRKPLYPLFKAACERALQRGIPTLEEFNRQWPPEQSKVVYIGVGA